MSSEHADKKHYHAFFFHTMEQQNSSHKLGMWAFLAQELLFFSGLFMAYIAMRYFYPDTFTEVQERNLLSIPMGFVNTVVLLFSSLTMALAVREAQLIPVIENEESKLHRSRMIKLLLVTAGLACVFLVIKYFEYSHKIHVGTVPGNFYHFAEWPVFRDADGTILGAIRSNGVIDVSSAPHIFFSLYFVITGTHGLRVVIGVGVILWLALRAKRGEFNQEYFAAIENVGLYWHLVDLIWIFVFPLMYLVA